MESTILDLVLRVENACAETLKPPPGATAAQVRSNGAVASALGLVLMLWVTHAFGRAGNRVAPQLCKNLLHN